ncbi:hypothetical protein [Nocardia macrotermitis]|uniref:Uncharacterized protein n=1 Tax=Nocardia macrotermitis TaxID=2585198 RepID=A0A7K0D3Z9_9NOCA|nr:hypothetical protein [Nocardia macrotermitis]MQY20448.1 hypothetical protein [Nocardia macrotermitis]
MPERVGRFTFYSREESEQMGIKYPSAEELAATDAIFEEFTRLGATLPPREGTPGLGWGEKYFIDDLVGTEFEGWTHDPATDIWFDAQGRPAYDAKGQRIQYPEDDARTDQGSGPGTHTPARPASDTDGSGGISFHI